MKLLIPAIIIAVLASLSLYAFLPIKPTGFVVDLNTFNAAINQSQDAEMPVSEEIQLAENDTINQSVDKCKNVVCIKSLIKCPDGFTAYCSNRCIEGKCTACGPSCSDHQLQSNQQTQDTSDNNQQSSCQEIWSCEDWSSCSAGTQTRVCADSNNCGTSANKPAETQSCAEGNSLSLSVTADPSIVQRGSTVVLTAVVTDGSNAVDSASITLTMTYASGTTAQSSGLTDSSGKYIWSKKIGGNSKTGTFSVSGKATKAGYTESSYTTTFEVVSAS